MRPSITQRWNGISLRSKITGVTVLLLTLGLLVAGIGTMAMLRQYVIQQVDAQLQADAQAALSGSANAFTQGNAEDGPSEYFIALYDADGQVQEHNWRGLATADLPVVSIPLDLQSVIQLDGRTQTFYNPARDTTFHAVAIPFVINPQGTYGTQLMAVSLRPTETTMATYLTIFLGFGAGVVLIGALLTRLLVTNTFAPLREAERTAAAIADGDFSQRLRGATPNTEVGRLNRSLNIMLNRIDGAFKDRARSIDQMRRFVGDASHELRTPLVTVRGYAELYRMGALLTPEEVTQAMDRIEKEAIRMGGLVEDLLELARLDEAKPLDLAPVDLLPIARDAALDTMASSTGRSVNVTVATPTLAPVAASDPHAGDLDHPSQEVMPLLGEVDAAGKPLSGGGTNGTHTGAISFAGATLARLRPRKPRRADVPAIVSEPVWVEAVGGAEAIVMAEENKIRQVITNLLGNALRFTPPDSPIDLEVAVDQKRRTASISVIDHGEGIPPQIREKIFQRFWRADSSRTRETGGSGLGLAIVAAIVASHHGTVYVTETPGGGATFRVSFPLATAPGAPKAVAAAAPPRGGG